MVIITLILGVAGPKPANSQRGARGGGGQRGAPGVRRAGVRGQPRGAELFANLCLMLHF